ncbi:MAG: Do family serine endopeptidase, partial [Ignavibacteria bacterium]|nr:Do family serine endopeptidase [Ignavibacteria bacterium]
MSKKSVLIALGLIMVGIVFGSLLVSNFSGGVGFGVAGGTGDIKLGGPTPITEASLDLQKASESFVAVSKAVTPTVVSITVTTAAGKSDVPQDFFHFFGPNFKSPEPQPSQGAGSGVIITPDGYIATNNHVVENAKEGGIEVVLNDKSRYRAKLIGTDPTTDLAIIKIEGKDLPVAALGNSDNVEVGEWVLAIGNPLGLTSTVTAGIISAVGRGGIGVIRTSEYGIENFIQTDAAINPGNSGGALVNIRGEVVGINTAIATTNARYQGYGFAVPVNLLKVVARDLIEFGTVRRGYIGVSIQSVDQTMADAVGLQKAQGVIVQQVVKDGAGEQAGVKEGDIILSVDGKEVNEANELQSYIASHHPGDVVTLQLFRDRKRIDKQVTLKARVDQTTTLASDKGTDKEEPVEASATKELKLESLGMTVRSLTAQEKKEAEVSGGVLVADVRPYGEAFERNVQKNAIILEADRKQVNSPSDLK